MAWSAYPTGFLSHQPRRVDDVATQWHSCRSTLVRRKERSPSTTGAGPPLLLDTKPARLGLPVPHAAIPYHRNQALSSGDADHRCKWPGCRICGSSVTSTPWLDDFGLVILPTGPRVRGRRSGDTVSPADFALVLGDSPLPTWPHRHIRWQDFWIPNDRVQALDGLHEALRRAHDGERVEVICSGGIGRTGTALAALAILDGLSPNQAVTWIRDNYNRRAVETPWQRRWLRTVR